MLAFVHVKKLYVNLFSFYEYLIPVLWQFIFAYMFKPILNKQLSPFIMYMCIFNVNEPAHEIMVLIT